MRKDFIEFESEAVEWEFFWWMLHEGAFIVFENDFLDILTSDEIYSGMYGYWLMKFIDKEEK